MPQKRGDIVAALLGVYHASWTTLKVPWTCAQT